MSFTINQDQVTETPELMKLLTDVNKEINKFRYEFDHVTYKQEDYWTAYIQKFNKGDCDDYTLTKRRLLIEAGVPYQCLFPTVCEVENEGHLVLIVRTDKNDYMLDSIKQDVDTVKKVRYKWLYRLNPLTKRWVKL